MRVAVIGAGPSGLVTLKYLLAAEQALGTPAVEVRLFESEDGVGGTFLSRTYEDAELVSSRQLTSFSDFRVNNDNDDDDPDPDFLSAKRYVQYLNDYCTHFKLWPHIHLSCVVTSLKTNNHKQSGSGSGSGRHVLTYITKGNDNQQQQQHIWECDAVAICSGLHVEPSIPALEGIDRVPITLHSSQFKSRAQFGVGKAVLILGSGETSADIAYLAVTAPTKRVVVCHRDGFHLAPKMNPSPELVFSRRRKAARRPQVPIDVSRASLFDTTYVHPWLRNSFVLWRYYDLYLRWILWVSWGTMHGYDQWIGGKPEGWTASEIFFNKAGHKVSPYISAAWRPKTPKTLLAKLRSLIVSDNTRDTSGRRIDVAPWPERIDEDGVVHFRDNKRPEYLAMKDQKIKPDVLVFCTGYKQTLTFLQHQQHQHQRENNDSSHENRSSTTTTSAPPSSFYDAIPSSGEGNSTLVRNIWPPSDPTLAFIGFVRPNLGAIPPLAELQAMLWVSRLLTPSSLPLKELHPSDEPHYRLTSRKGARIHYGVDHESYAYQLALDMGAAPGLGDIVRIAGGGGGGAGVHGDSKLRRKRQQQQQQQLWRWWWWWEGGFREFEWRLPLTWALGANFNTKFRLCGPWRWDGARDVMVGELWETVARREVFFGHITLSIFPMIIFGPLSLLVFLVASLSDFFCRVIGIQTQEDRRRAAADVIKSTSHGYVA